MNIKKRPHDLSRRKFLRTGVMGSAAGLTVTGCAKEQESKYSSKGIASEGIFAHGVASGDPTSSSVILWTRISVQSDGPLNIRWQIAETADFNTPITDEMVRTSAAQDWTVKVDAQNLPTGRTFFYRFLLDENSSPIGITRTLPEGAVDQARFAIVSCANYPQGYFNGYDHIARQDHFDAVIHLGDYFYEYGPDGYGGDMGDEIDRAHEPAHEILSLEDYRTRHAQYKRDTALQSMHQAHPVICLWDDHETANDSWKDGAQNHQDSEGTWHARVRNAMQAYYEWMPVRDPEPDRSKEALYRSYKWGDLLTMVTLETRLTARSEQREPENYFDTLTSKAAVDAFRRDILGAEDRYMIGSAQLDFVTSTLKESKEAEQPWRIIANQILMAKLDAPDLNPYLDETAISNIEKVWSGIRDFVRSSAFGLPLYADTWSGYPVARENFYKALAAVGVTDAVVLTGDAHEFWVNDLYSDDQTKMGIELGTTSISSTTLEALMGAGTEEYSLLTTKENDEARYYNANQNGYIDLTLTREQGEARLIAIDTVRSPEYTTSTLASFTFKSKKKSVNVTRAKGLTLKQFALFKGWA